MQVGAEPENRYGGAAVAETMDTAGSVRRLSWFDATVEGGFGRITPPGVFQASDKSPG